MVGNWEEFCTQARKNLVNIWPSSEKNPVAKMGFVTRMTDRLCESRDSVCRLAKRGFALFQVNPPPATCSQYESPLNFINSTYAIYMESSVILSRSQECFTTLYHVAYIVLFLLLQTLV